jgi:hypothetical protein
MWSADEICDLGLGLVSVHSNTLKECNGRPRNSAVDSLRIFGNGTKCPISISASSVKLHLDGVNASSPLVIHGSSAVVASRGSNIISSNRLRGAGMRFSCSSITLTSVNAGHVKAHGTDQSAGIGSEVGDSCESHSIENTSVSAFGQIGIGTAGLESGDISSIQTISIKRSSIEASG